MHTGNNVAVAHRHENRQGFLQPAAVDYLFPNFKTGRFLALNRKGIVAVLREYQPNSSAANIDNLTASS